jgi:hypothetical protein
VAHLSADLLEGRPPAGPATRPPFFSPIERLVDRGGLAFGDGAE